MILHLVTIYDLVVILPWFAKSGTSISLAWPDRLFFFWCGGGEKFFLRPHTKRKISGLAMRDYTSILVDNRPHWVKMLKL